MGSKLPSATVSAAVAEILAEAKDKKRNFVETIELQIGLKNYDTKKDKRFSGTIKLPHVPRPRLKVRFAELTLYELSCDCGSIS
mmetsp:Transcript_159/g.362  ORF Transcript_159/g.362 Transcript_159/m.362 type:complete len:84 (+) Transcript_159:181-432(+)